MTTTTWRLVPAQPDQGWIDTFAARGPRIGTFGATIRAVLDTAPLPDFNLVQALRDVRAALAFLPAADPAVIGLDRLISSVTTGGACDDAPPRAADTNGDR
ncbi:hypothetical protein ABE485_12085 [Achromobacter spanius]|jgi:hypothetical protein|uniref:hypothetical protein n=1 Tax=Achromobacter spanius TaxID=217203 RepID=UPI003208BFB4